jgi:hypothetical protein
MRRCSGILAVVALWCAGFASGAQAAPVRVGSVAAGTQLVLTPQRLAWIGPIGGRERALSWSRGVLRNVAPVGVGSISELGASSTLMAWTRIDEDLGHSEIAVHSLHREVALPSGRVVVTDRCASPSKPCGCVDLDDTSDTGGALAVDGDRVAVGRIGCRRGVTVYERRGNRLVRRAVLPDAAAFGFLLAGRYLAWSPGMTGDSVPVTLYDWKRGRVVRRFRDLPFPAGDVELTLSRTGRILARNTNIADPGSITLVLERDGSRRRIRGIGLAQWIGADRLQQVIPPRVTDAGLPAGPWRRLVVALGHRPVSRPIAQPPGLVDTGLIWPAYAADGRCIAWQTTDGSVWLDAIDGETSRAPACARRATG